MLFGLYFLCSIERTQVLHVLVCDHLYGRAHCLPALLLGAERLEHDDAIRGGGRNEGGAVAELRPAAVVVEGNVAETRKDRWRG